MNRLAIPLLLVAGFLAGCGSPPKPIDDPTTQRKAEPWETLAKRLRKDTDLASCKVALGQLNNDLSDRKDVSGPSPLAKDAEEKLAAAVPLTDFERRELRPAGYSSLDQVYLADCFYLRDAARSLDPSGLPPADLASAGFDWACRQVYLEPWIIERHGYVPAVPPTYVLGRGSGSGLERAYVFLALLQQMGLDGCLIGPPDAADKPAGHTPNDKEGKPLTGPAKGPFWAVGARVGADVLLFEPWRGQPFPGPGGKGIGTLAQAQTNPEQLKAWLDEKWWNVTADDLKSGMAYLAVPLNSLSPRIALLEEKLKADSGVKLAIDPVALKGRFTAAPPAGPGLPVDAVKFWNPPTDRFTYTRATAAFLPAEEGGLDRADAAHLLFMHYQRALHPEKLLGLPPDIRHEEVTLRLRQAAIVSYASAFNAPPTPRERIQRGRFQDAARDLTDKQAAFNRGLERLRAIDPSEIADWCKAANDAYDAVNRARYPSVGQTVPQPESDSGVVAARAAAEEFWRARAIVVQTIVDRASAAIGRGEAAFLLALLKHEEAERQQIRADRAAAADAARLKTAANDSWREAANAWDSYVEQAGGVASAPGRTDHARSLADRAKKFAAAK